VSANQQLALLEAFESPRPPNPVFCHQEFLEKLAEQRPGCDREASRFSDATSVGGYPPLALQGDGWH